MTITFKPFLRLVSLCLLILTEGSALYAQNTLDLAGLSSGSQAYVAFSTRRLSTSYLGNVMQVRRSSDNTTQNIGFTVGGDLDVTALMAFVGGGSGFVSIWYDQSGNGRNMTQATLINQPRIVNAGTLDVENAKPFIRFFKSGTYNSLELGSEMSVVGMVSTVNKFASGARGFLLGHSTFFNWHDQPPRLFATYASASLINGKVFQNGATAIGSAANWNTTLMVNTVLPLTPANGTQWDNIGRDRTIYNHTEAGGGHTELIAFTAAIPATERMALEKNQGAYYGISVLDNNLNRNGALVSTTATMVNNSGKSGASALTPTGRRVSFALAAAPTTSELTLIGNTAQVKVTLTNYDDAGTIAGICWGTNTNPTIADSRASNPITASSFTATTTALTNGTTYYVRSYITNSAGTTYGNQITFVHVSPGYAYLGGKVAYVYKPADPGYVEGEVHGIIAATADLIPTAAFGCNGTNITGAEGSALGTGQANTTNIVAQCGTAGIAARICDNHSVTEGVTTYSDWFLPSIAELAELFNNRTAIGGFGSPVRYWSSTEGTASPAGDAQIVLFNANGDISGYAKSNNNPRARPVRYF